MTIRFPLKLLAIAMLAFVAMFALAADDSVAVQAQYDKSNSATPATVDINLTVADCQTIAPKTRESVGMTVLNLKLETFTPAKELEGYRTVIDKPKIAQLPSTNEPEIVRLAFPS